MRTLVADLDHLDETIRIFDPDADFGPANAHPTPVDFSLKRA